jgi:hypothetical protein
VKLPHHKLAKAEHLSHLGYLGLVFAFGHGPYTWAALVAGLVGLLAFYYGEE